MSSTASVHAGGSGSSLLTRTRAVYLSHRGLPPQVASLLNKTSPSILDWNSHLSDVLGIDLISNIQL